MVPLGTNGGLSSGLLIGLILGGKGRRSNAKPLFLVGQAGKPVKAKGRAGCPPHKKLFLQKWDAPTPSLASEYKTCVLALGGELCVMPVTF